MSDLRISKGGEGYDDNVRRMSYAADGLVRNYYNPVDVWITRSLYQGSAAPLSRPANRGTGNNFANWSK